MRARAGRTWGLASLCAGSLQMALLCYHTKTSSLIYKCLLKMAHHFFFFSSSKFMQQLQAGRIKKGKNGSHDLIVQSDTL